MAGPYRDFIPAGDDPGAMGQGFKDYQPMMKPQTVTVPELDDSTIVPKDEPVTESTSSTIEHDFPIVPKEELVLPDDEVTTV